MLFYSVLGIDAVDKAAFVQFAHDGVIYQILNFHLADFRIARLHEALHVAHPFGGRVGFLIHPPQYILERVVSTVGSVMLSRLVRTCNTADVFIGLITNACASIMALMKFRAISGWLCVKACLTMTAELTRGICSSSPRVRKPKRLKRGIVTAYEAAVDCSGFQGFAEDSHVAETGDNQLVSLRIQSELFEG